MAVKQVSWNDGTGDYLYVDPNGGGGTGTLSVTSDPNTGSADRSITFSVVTSAGSPQRTVTVSVTQEGRKAPPNYFWTEAIASGTFTLTIPASVTTAHVEYVSYSLNGGTTWTTTQNSSSAVTITTPTVAAGDKVLWKAIATRYASSSSGSNYCHFTGSANFNIGGDIASLFTGDTCSLSEISASTGMLSFFRDNTTLINAEDLILSPTTIGSRCFQNFFNGCSNLETAPTINATTTGTYGMYAMFQSCTSLVEAPEINLTTIASNCCNSMFSGCSALTTPPSKLKATTFSSSCYYSMFLNCSKLESCPEIWATTFAASSNQWCRQMFRGCKKITTGPVLNCTTLASQCYYQMFYGCTALNWIKMMATDISASNCLYQWVSNVASSGTFVKNSSAQWTTTGVSGIPTGWTVQTASS